MSDNGFLIRDIGKLYRYLFKTNGIMGKIKMIVDKGEDTLGKAMDLALVSV